MIKKRLSKIPQSQRIAYWHQSVLHLYRYIALARVWGFRSLAGDFGPPLEPACRRRSLPGPPFRRMRLGRSARFVQIQPWIKAIRARFVQILRACAFPESQLRLRLFPGLGMALIVSGMLRFPFDGSWSGYRWRSASRIVVFTGVAHCFWHLSLITLLLSYQLSFNKIKYCQNILESW